MRVLCNENNIIVAIREKIEFGRFEGEEKWKISEYFYMLDNNYRVFDVEEVPSDIAPNKNCYTIEEGFYLNPSWVEKINIEEELTKIKKENEELKEQTQTLLDCLLEMSEVVYGV